MVLLMAVTTGGESADCCHGHKSGRGGCIGYACGGGGGWGGGCLGGGGGCCFLGCLFGGGKHGGCLGGGGCGGYVAPAPAPACCGSSCGAPAASCPTCGTGAAAPGGGNAAPPAKGGY